MSAFFTSSTKRITHFSFESSLSDVFAVFSTEAQTQSVVLLAACLKRRRPDKSCWWKQEAQTFSLPAGFPSSARGSALKELLISCSCTSTCALSAPFGRQAATSSGTSAETHTPVRTDRIEVFSAGSQCAGWLSVPGLFHSTYLRYPLLLYFTVNFLGYL